MKSDRYLRWPFRVVPPVARPVMFRVIVFLALPFFLCVGIGIGLAGGLSAWWEELRHPME